MTEKQGVIELPHIEVLEIFGPEVAAQRALRPGEYAEVGLRYDEPNQLMRVAAAASLALHLCELVTLGDTAISPRDNLMVKIQRKYGPKPSFRDYLIYYKKRLQVAFH